MGLVMRGYFRPVDEGRRRSINKSFLFISFLSNLIFSFLFSPKLPTKAQSSSKITAELALSASSAIAESVAESLASRLYSNALMRRVYADAIKKLQDLLSKIQDVHDDVERKPRCAAPDAGDVLEESVGRQDVEEFPGEPDRPVVDGRRRSFNSEEKEEEETPPAGGEVAGLDLRLRETSEDFTGTSSYSYSTMNVNDASSTTTETIFIISPTSKFKRRIRSWTRGVLRGSGSYGMVYEAISE